MQGINTGILFNPFMKDWGNGRECTYNTFADWTKLGGVADAPEACAAMQRALTGWADRNLTTQGSGVWLGCPEGTALNLCEGSGWDCPAPAGSNQPTSGHRTR